MPTPTGFIYFTSVPSGAGIYVDGTYQGITPKILSGLTTGSHAVKLTITGYNDYSATVDVSKEQTATVSKDFTQPPAGSLSITSTPSGASVYVDDSYLGVTPIILSKQTPGTHIVKLKKTGYKDYSYIVIVHEEQTTTVSGDLTPIVQTSPMGTLFITSSPLSASIYVDGSYQGTTPTTLTETTGSYRIRFTKTGYTDYSTIADVSAGQTTTVSGYLNPITLVQTYPPTGVTTLVPSPIVRPVPTNNESSNTLWLVLAILAVLFLAVLAFFLNRKKLSGNKPPSIKTEEISRNGLTPSTPLSGEKDLISHEDLTNRFASVEQKASELLHFSHPVQALIAKAQEQYHSKAYDIARTTLNTAEEAITPLKLCETQLTQWKKDGYITTSIESMNTDTINTINTSFRDFEQDLLILKQQELQILELKRLYNTENADPSITQRIAGIESQLHDPRNIHTIKQEIDAIQKTDEKQKIIEPDLHNDEDKLLSEAAFSAIEKGTTEPETHGSTEKPELTLTLDHTRLIADDWDRMTIQVTNHGIAPAKDVRLTFSHEFNTKRIKPVTINAGETISLDIGIRPKFKGKIPLEITAIYRDSMDKKCREMHEFWIDIIEKSASPKSGIPISPAGQFIQKHRTPKQLPPELSDRYTESEFIGKGGFARIFKAKRKDGKYIAVKIPISMDATTGRSFITEMHNWTRLSHPNIVELYDFNIIPIPYFEEELCDSALSEQKKPIGSEEAALILFNVCEGLKFAHFQKIIHRDLKPQNILIKNGVPKISDWGLSRIISERTTTTATSFTAYYAAPEQIGNKKKDERTDIWQLGVIFYELVTGVLPFSGDSIIEVMAGIATKNPTKPSVISQSSKDVESIIMKCLEKKPGKRYQSVLALQKDLALYMRVTYTELLKTSVSVQDYSRSAFYCGDLVMVNLLTGDMKSAYKYILDLIHYSKGDVKAEAQELSEQIKMRMDMGLEEIPTELIQKAEIIVHQISAGFRNKSAP